MYPKPSQKPSQNHTKSMPKLRKSPNWWGDLGATLCQDWLLGFFGPKDDFWYPDGWPWKSRSAKKRPQKFNTTAFSTSGRGLSGQKCPPSLTGSDLRRSLIFWTILEGCWLHFGIIFACVFNDSNIDVSSLILDRISMRNKFFPKFRFFWNRLPIREKQGFTYFCLLFSDEKW